MGVDLLSPLASLIAWRCIPEAGRSEIRRVGFATCNTFAGEFLPRREIRTSAQDPPYQ